MDVAISALRPVIPALICMAISHLRDQHRDSSRGVHSSERQTAVAASAPAPIALAACAPAPNAVAAYVQNAPGDLSLRGTEETAVAAARESEDDTALGGTEETAVAAAHEAENDN